MGRQSGHPAVRVVEDDELRGHCLVADERGGEDTQHGEVLEHAGIETAAGVADHQRVAELQIEQVGRIDSGIETGEHDSGEAKPNGKFAVGEALGEPAVAFE